LFWEIGHLNTSTTFEGVLQDRAAGQVGNLTKVGTGKLTLTAVNTYTGDTTISNGILALTATATIDNSPMIILLRTNAVFDVSAFSPAWTNALARTVGGNGIITGAVVVTSGTLSPGTSIGKLTFANDLFIDGNSGTTTNLFEIGTSTNDSIVVAGNLDLSGITAVRVVPTGALIKNGTYALYKWSGTLTGDTNNLALEYPSQAGTLVLGTNLATKEIFLQVSGVPTAGDVTWRGDGGANLWDLATQNWRAGVNPSVFNNGDNVTFNNAGSNNVPVDITVAAGPSSVTVNATKDYSFSTTSSGRISGGGSLYKTNTGKLTLTTEND
jgi:autotransporter-associated beta strand protein